MTPEIRPRTAARGPRIPFGNGSVPPTVRGTPPVSGLQWRRTVAYPWRMEQREEPVTMTTATDEERADARARFRRKLAEAEARMTPEKRAKVRTAFGLDTDAA